MSLEAEVTFSKRGRPVKRVYYHKLHYGKTAQINAGPRTWLQAMLSSDVEHLRYTAGEEIRSLKETGTVKLIDRNELPKGRTLIKSK